MKTLFIICSLLISSHFLFQEETNQVSIYEKKWVYQYSYNDDTTIIFDLPNNLFFTEITFLKDQENYRRLYPKMYKIPKHSSMKNVVLLTSYKSIQDTAVCNNLKNNWLVYLGANKFEFKIVAKTRNRIELKYSYQINGTYDFKHVFKVKNS